MRNQFLFIATVMLVGAAPHAAPTARATQTSPGASSFDPRRAVHDAVLAIRRVAMNRDRLDWAAIEARAQTEAASAKDEGDLLPIYARILYQLDDNRHSRVVASPPALAAFEARFGDRPYLPDLPRPPIRSRYTSRRTVTGTDVALPNGGVARGVTIPAFNGRDADGQFAGSIHAALTATPRACGYLVDLRGNTGGNTFPMIAGLATLLGDGFRMAVPTEAGMATAVIQNGAVNGFATPTSPPFKLAFVPDWHPLPQLATAPVAVLFDDGTASAGEGVAIEFVHRPDTRSFGATTGGHASANMPVQVTGAILMVTTALVPDRTGATFRNGIAPDEPVAAGPEGGPDPVIAAAAAWLSRQRACR